MEIISLKDFFSKRISTVKKRVSVWSLPKARGIYCVKRWRRAPLLCLILALDIDPLKRSCEIKVDSGESKAMRVKLKQENFI